MLGGNVASFRRAVFVVLLTWLAMRGADFFLHAGILARLYLELSPFLLPPSEAFTRIPLGYLASLVLAVLLVWLMARLRISGWRGGLAIGLKLGLLVWGAETLGLRSISTADATLLFGWFFGQTISLGTAGAVAGRGLGGVRLPRLLLAVAVFVLAAVIVTVALQSAGLAPAARFEGQ